MFNQFSKNLKLASALALAGMVSTFMACGGSDGVVAEVAEELSPGQIANRDFVNKLDEKQLLAELSKGGNVVYFRHTQTEKDFADQADPKLVLGDCSTQRKLSAAGVVDANSIGEGFEAQNIPVGDVIASDYCRAWKGANIAFGRYVRDPRLNFLPFEEYTDAQVEQMKTTVTPLLIATPQTGKNTVIFGHDDIFEAATGIYPEPQGVAYVLKPDGKGAFAVQAKVQVQRWGKFAK